MTPLCPRWLRAESWSPSPAREESPPWPRSQKASILPDWQGVWRIVKPTIYHLFLEYLEFSEVWCERKNFWFPSIPGEDPSLLLNSGDTGGGIWRVLGNTNSTLLGVISPLSLLLSCLRLSSGRSAAGLSEFHLLLQPHYEILWFTDFTVTAQARTRSWMVIENRGLKIEWGSFDKKLNKNSSKMENIYIYIREVKV